MYVICTRTADASYAAGGSVPKQSKAKRASQKAAVSSPSSMGASALAEKDCVEAYDSDPPSLRATLPPRSLPIDDADLQAKLQKNANT